MFICYHLVYLFLKIRSIFERQIEKEIKIDVLTVGLFSKWQQCLDMGQTQSRRLEFQTSHMDSREPSHLGHILLLF